MSGIITTDWLARERRRIEDAMAQTAMDTVMQQVSNQNTLGKTQTNFTHPPNVSWIWNHKDDLEKAGYTVEKHADKATLKW
jgi:hypothetical protein